MRTDGHTDMTKLTVTFHNCAKAPKMKLSVIRRTHRVLLSLHLTNALRNLNAPYTHAEA